MHDNFVTNRRLQVNPLVSIIVPVYGVELYIENCVKSILNQTYNNLEVIFIDDCSPDKSMEIVKSVIDNTDRSSNITIKYLKHDINRGQSAARNTGMAVATGEYVYFLDSDDEIIEDCIEKLVAVIKNKRYDIVIGGYMSINGENRKISCRGGVLLDHVGIFNSFVKGEWNAMPWNKLCDLDFLRKNRLSFQEGVLHEDVLWNFKALFIAEAVCFVDSPIYKYYIRQNSSSHSLDKVKKRIDSLLIVFQEMYDFQYKQQRFEYLVDCAIRRFFPLFEETMRQLPSFSLWDFYKKIRTADSRTISQKRYIYNTVVRKLRYLDYFLPVSVGFIYRYSCWCLVRIKAGHAHIPFIY